MKRIAFVLSLYLCASIASAAPITFQLTAKQLLDAIDAQTVAECGNPESQGCAFYAFTTSAQGGGTLAFASTTAPDYTAIPLTGTDITFTDSGLDATVAFLTRSLTALNGTFGGLIGQSGPVAAGANVAESALFTFTLDQPGLIGNTANFNMLAYGVVLNPDGTEALGKPSVDFRLSLTAVPEPGTYALLGTGFGLLGVIGGYARRKKA